MAATSAAAELSPADESLLHTIVRQTARTFYTPPEILVLDRLIAAPILRDRDLALRLGQAPLRDVVRYADALYRHGLLRKHERIEYRQGSNRASSAMYYVLDFPQFLDVLKYRLYRCRASLDAAAARQTTLDVLRYRCQACAKDFDAFDVLSLSSSSSSSSAAFENGGGGFRCDACGVGVLVEHVDTAAAHSTDAQNARMHAFAAQLAPLRLNLERAQAIPIPYLDVDAFLDRTSTALTAATAIHAAHQARANHAAAATDALLARDKDGIRIAGSAGTGLHSQALQILLSDATTTDNPVDPAQAPALAQVPNSLPEWHARSTITGERTALGLSHQASMAARPLESRPVDTAEARVETHDLDAYYASLNSRPQTAQSNGSEKRDAPVQVGGSPEARPTERDKRKREVVSVALVAGKPKPIEEITDDDIAEMTPDEYTAYFEMLE